MQEVQPNGDIRITCYSYAESLQELAKCVQQGYQLVTENQGFPSCFMGHYEFTVRISEEKTNESKTDKDETKATSTPKPASRGRPRKNT